MSNSNALVQKLWNDCNILRDDGLSYGDQVEQLTFLLFLKMADVQPKPPFNKPSVIPEGYGWADLLKLEDDELEVHYPTTKSNYGLAVLVDFGLLARSAASRPSMTSVKPFRSVQSVPSPA